VAHLLRLTDGVTTIELGGTDTSYGVHDAGFDPGYPPIVKTERKVSLIRTVHRVIAHSHGNRPMTIRPMVAGASPDALQVAQARFDALIEQSRRRSELGETMLGNRPVYLVWQLQNSTKRYWSPVRDGYWEFPQDWFSFGLVADAVFESTLRLEADPYLHGPWRPIVERQGSSSASGLGYGSGLVLNGTNWVVMPGTTELTVNSGVISFWLWNTHAYNAATKTILHEQSGNFKLQLDSSRLTFSVNFNVGGVPTAGSTYITLNSGTWAADSLHHICLTWGQYGTDYQHGLALYLDGVKSVTGNVGSVTALYTMGQIRAGREWDNSNQFTGAIDDIRHGLNFDGIYLVSAADLYSGGKEADSLTTVGDLDTWFRGDATYPSYVDVGGVPGNVAPNVRATLGVVSGGTGLAKLWAANRVKPSTSFTHQREAESFNTLLTGASAAVDAACSNGNRLDSARTPPNAPTSVTVTPQGTPGSTTYNYWVVAVFSDGSESLVSSGGTTTTGNATLSSTNFNRITWAAASGAVGYIICRVDQRSKVGQVGAVTTFDDTGYSVTPYTRSKESVVATAYDYIYGPDFYGFYRIKARCRINHTYPTWFQVVVAQGDATYARFSTAQLIDSALNGYWQELDFGVFPIPLAATPEGMLAECTVTLYDSGNSTYPAQWDRVQFIPFGDKLDYVEWRPASTAPLASLSWAQFREDGEVYRVEFDAANSPRFKTPTGAIDGKFPTLVPGQTNRLIFGGNRATNTESVITDQVVFYGAIQGRTINLR
jgi:hypothetical protein